MVDTLSRKLDADREEGKILGIRLEKGRPSLNHTLFVDDSLFLGGASLKNARAFKYLIQNYCQDIVAMVNKIKSVVYSWNVDQTSIHKIIDLLEFIGYASLEKK